MINQPDSAKDLNEFIQTIFYMSGLLGLGLMFIGALFLTFGEGNHATKRGSACVFLGILVVALDFVLYTHFVPH